MVSILIPLINLASDHSDQVFKEAGQLAAITSGISMGAAAGASAAPWNTWKPVAMLPLSWKHKKGTD